MYNAMPVYKQVNKQSQQIYIYIYTRKIKKTTE